jgi:hypothetical protein
MQPVAAIVVSDFAMASGDEQVRVRQVPVASLPADLKPATRRDEPYRPSWGRRSTFSSVRRMLMRTLCCGAVRRLS